jgi:hypothetical protein
MNTPPATIMEMKSMMLEGSVENLDGCIAVKIYHYS